MAGRSFILSAPMLLLLLVHSLRLASADTVPLAAVTGYRLPGIFALNDGKPFYLDRDPVTGVVTFNPSGGGTTQQAVVPSEPMAAESSPVADAATAADEYEEDEEDGADHRPAPAAVAHRDRPAGPLKAAPVVEEVEEDEPPPHRAAPLSKDEIDRKDTVSSSKGSSGGRPNEIQDGGNPYFHQFLNLNVHEYGDRIPGASSVRDDPYSFGELGIGSSPLEREYKFPLISSSYASTKVQGAGGNYFYGPKGNDREKNKEKDKYRPAYADHYTPSSTKKPTPSYYHESGNDDDDHYYGRPSSSTSTSSASNPEEEEEEDYHKFAGSSHNQGNRGDSEEGADEEEEEEGGESIDELVEEVSDYNRPPVHPKRPEAPPRQPPKESSPTTHHHHYQGDEAEEEASQDYDEDKPSYNGGGGGGFGSRPAADKPRPQQTYYYGEEEEEEEQEDVPQRKPTRVQGADQGEEDRPKPSQASEEESEEEGGEEGESTVKEKPQKLPPKPSLSYLGFSSDFDRDHDALFGEKFQGSQKVEKPANEGPGYNYGYSGPPHNFGIDSFYSTDLEGPQKKPSQEPETVHSAYEDEKPQPSNKKEEGAKEEEEEDEEEVVRKPYDNRRPYNPPQVVRFTPAHSSQAPTERLPAQQSPTTPKPTTTTKHGTYYKPSYQSPYGIEEPFRPIYGPGEDDEPIRPRPGQSYQQSNNRQEIQQQVRPSSVPPYRATPSPDTRPSGVIQYDSYYPIRPQNVNILPPNKKDNLPETTRKDPITSTYKPYYDSKTKKPIEQGPPSWKVYPSNNANGSQSSKPSQDESKESTVLREQVKPAISNQEIITRRPPTLPPPPSSHREIIGIGSVGEPEYVQPANNKPSYGPFRFPEQDYAPQRPVHQPQNGLTFAQRPSTNNPVTAKPSLPPPPFGFPPQGPQRPILPPSQNIRPQLSENHPPQYLPQRPPPLGGGPPLPPPPRRWEDRPIHPHPSARPPSQNFLHRPPPSRSQDQPLNGLPPTGGHPYKFVSRKPSQEPVLMGSAPNAVFGNAFNPSNKKSPSPNGPKAQAPDPNLPNILPQFRPNAKISYSTIQRENRPFGIPPPPPPQYGPNQRISNVPERRIISPFYDHLQPPPPPPNRLQRIHGPEHEIPYGPPQVYPFGPGGGPPVGRRSGQHHQARVGEDSFDSSSENEEESRRPQVTTLQMMRNGLMDHQAARHPIVSKEESDPKSTADPTTATIQLKPTVYITPDEGATGASLSVDSSASEDHPVFVVYPVSSDPSTREDGVVIGTRGSQRPLPPSSIAAESEISVLPQRPNSVLSDFPYPLLKPSSALPTKPSKTDSEIVGPIYTSVAEEVPEDHMKENTESNIIPYLQDYSPYATRKPAVAPQSEQSSTPAATEPSLVTTSPPSMTTSTTENPSTRAPVTIVNAWQPDSEVEVSATMHTGHSSVPVNHRPLIEEKKEVSSPPPLNFQAPFHASENIDPAPDSGWSAIGGSPSTDFPTGGSSSISRVDYNTGTNGKDNDSDNGDTSKFDFDNFKPQLFGGFKPIITHPSDGDEGFKYALGTTERQER